MKNIKRIAAVFGVATIGLTTLAGVSAQGIGTEFALGEINITKQTDMPWLETKEPEVKAATTEEPSEPEATPEPEQIFHEVKPGDSLSKIAAHFSTTWKRLFDANDFIKDPSSISAGQKIRIPAAEEVLAARSVPVAPKPAVAVSARRTSSASAARMVDDGSVWYRLAMCEAGGRPNAVSANGLYHGMYQFRVDTWRAVGGSGFPSQASAAEQTKRAQILQARSGWGQWPACARKLGLL